MAQTVRLVVLLTLGILAAPLTSDAQQPLKVPVIGMLTPAPHPMFAAFRQGLHALGYIEGQNITLEYRFADWRLEQLPDLTAALVQRPVDVFVTDGNSATLAAKTATQTIPIVVATSVSPVERGLVNSLARPGGNITGLAFTPQELSGKRLELLREAVPGVTHVAYLWHPGAFSPAATLQEVERVARALVVQLHPLEVRGPKEFDEAFAAMTQEHVGAFMTMGSAVFLTHHTQIVELAAKYRLPGVFPDREFAEVGGFMTYGPSLRESFRRVATFVDKILKGSKPTDLPVEQPMKFEFIINLKTAKALGITIPPVLLFQADEVLQ